jgi:hypothetical protein
MDCNSFSNKDWIYLAGLAITLGLFWWRLKADTRFATYRETVSYLERRTDNLRCVWNKIDSKIASNDDIIHFLSDLDQVALLVVKKGFDEELVYNYWWNYFYSPLNLSAVRKIFDSQRLNDKTVYQNYLNLSNKWQSRILKEKGVA